MNGQKIITCPQCEGNHVQKADFTSLLFLGGILTVWIPVIGWFIIGPLFFIAGFINGFKKGTRFMCQDCKKGFKVSKGRYIEYKRYFKEKVS